MKSHLAAGVPKRRIAIDDAASRFYSDIDLRVMPVASLRADTYKQGDSIDKTVSAQLLVRGRVVR
jgi:hypothetical protein